MNVFDFDSIAAGKVVTVYSLRPTPFNMMRSNGGDLFGLGVVDSAGNTATDGSAKVQPNSAGFPFGSQMVELNVMALALNVNGTGVLSQVQWDFVYKGGDLNLSVNGDSVAFTHPQDVQNTQLGGVDVTVDFVGPIVAGDHVRLTLKGDIEQQYFHGHCTFGGDEILMGQVSWLPA